MSETTSPSAFRGFSLRESATIRKQIVTRGARLLCPRCGSSLVLGPAQAGRDPDDTGSWELRCEPCQRRLVVRRPDMPVDPTGDP